MTNKLCGAACGGGCGVLLLFALLSVGHLSATQLDFLLARLVVLCSFSSLPSQYVSTFGADST